MDNISIDGRTSFLAVIGYDTQLSEIPELMNAIISYMGYNACMLAFNTNEHGVHNTLEALKILDCKGILVDAPHRTEIQSFLSRQSKDASLCDSVNVIKLDNQEFIGHNTELDAFLKTFYLTTKDRLTGKKIFLIGSGAIAKTIAVACAKEGCESLYIGSRSHYKACELADKVNEEIGFLSCACDLNEPDTIHSFYNCDIIINATSAGSLSQMNLLPLPEKYNFVKHHLVYDINFIPPTTKFMQLAEEKECKFCNGKDLIFTSCINSFKWLTDVNIDNETENKLFHIWTELIYNV